MRLKGESESHFRPKIIAAENQQRSRELVPIGGRTLSPGIGRTRLNFPRVKGHRCAFHDTSSNRFPERRHRIHN